VTVYESASVGVSDATTTQLGSTSDLSMACTAVPTDLGIWIVNCTRMPTLAVLGTVTRRVRKSPCVVLGKTDPSLLGMTVGDGQLQEILAVVIGTRDSC